MTTKFRNAALYWGGAPAVGTLVGEGISASVRAPREWIEDTAYGDTNRTYQVGFLDFEMTFGRHYDEAAGAGMTLHDDAVAANPSAKAFYFYGDRATSGDYWYGNAYAALDSWGGDMGSLIDEEYALRATGAVTHKHA